jgi:primase-polymerase (primpol)-like protein
LDFISHLVKEKYQIKPTICLNDAYNTYMTPLQLDFIKRHAKEYSTRDTSRILKINHNTIWYQAKKHGIKFERFFDNSNLEQFKNIETPEIAYFLGFLWAGDYSPE